MRLSRLAFVPGALLVLSSSVACGTTIHVPDGEPTIQAGIDAASTGDTVLVACGTYYEHDIVMRSGVYLTSETGLADCATVDAQQQGRVFYCDGVDGSTSIVGFTIAEGLATGSYPENSGGGIYCHSSSPMLTGCTFSENEAEYGGGMSCESFSSPTLTACTFSENQAGDSGGGMGCYYDCAPTLAGCTFSGNQALGGGGIVCLESSPTLTDCTFSGNVAGITGGGGEFMPNSWPVLTRCEFSGNEAQESGGAVGCIYSGPTLTNCTFSENRAEDGGGMSCDFGSTPVLTFCIMAFGPAGEAVCCLDDDSTPSLVCCDLYGNAGGDWVGCVADQYGVEGNFSEDPLFCDMTNDDFALASNSPCLPDSNDCHVLIGAHGEGCEESPVQASSWGAIKAMYR